jgi:pimeloyl-ACP methyl ester carboxylesterase
MDHTVWVMQTRYFAHHGYNVFAVDLPGHGRSEGNVCSSVEDYAEWIKAFCESVGVQTSVIAGHSLGSLITLDAAARHPSTFIAAAMIGIAVPMGVAEPLQDAASADAHQAFDMITVWGLSMPAQVGGGPHAPGVWLTESSLRLLERSGPGVLGNDLRCCDNYEAGQTRAASMTQPALVLLGQLDMMTPPKAARSLIKALPNANVTVIDTCGHMLMNEQPDAVLDALIAFAAHAYAESA